MTGYLGISKNPQFISRDTYCLFSKVLNISVKDYNHCLKCYGNLCSTKQVINASPNFQEDFSTTNFAQPVRVQLPVTGDMGIYRKIKRTSNAGYVTSRLKKGHLTFHILLKTEDLGLLRYRMGKKNYSRLMNSYLHIAQKEITLHHSRGIIWEDNLIRTAFVSAQQAISCIMSLNNSMKSIAGQLILKMVLKQRLVGEKKDEELIANPLFFYRPGKIKPVIEQEVIQLAGDQLHQRIVFKEDVDIIKSEDQTFLNSLIGIIKSNWQNPFFSVADLCIEMSSSKSRLYRGCKKVTGISPIRLIKEYRLLRSLRSLKSQKNITEIVYDSGFNSLSYFSRCFKNRFGMSPYFYQKNLA